MESGTLASCASSPTAPTGAVVTGADTFVFAPDNGGDFIHDFRQSDHDRIDVSPYGFTGLNDMTITFDGANTRIDFDAPDSVTLVGFADSSALRPTDFNFCLICRKGAGQGAKSPWSLLPRSRLFRRGRARSRRSIGRGGQVVGPRRDEMGEVVQRRSALSDGAAIAGLRERLSG